jgi:hypothetical protein
MTMHNHTETPETRGPHWLTDLRPLEVCALVGALAFIAYRFFCR